MESVEEASTIMVSKLKWVWRLRSVSNRGKNLASLRVGMMIEKSGGMGIEVNE